MNTDQKEEGKEGEQGGKETHILCPPETVFDLKLCVRLEPTRTYLGLCARSRITNSNGVSPTPHDPVSMRNDTAGKVRAQQSGQPHFRTGLAMDSL